LGAVVPGVVDTAGATVIGTVVDKCTGSEGATGLMSGAMLGGDVLNGSSATVNVAKSAMHMSASQAAGRRIGL
jgi:hypothetical protein